MADFLTTNTPRLKVLQTGPRGSHHMVFRADPSATPGDVVTEVRSILTTMIPMCLEQTLFISAEWAPEGSEVFLPISWGASIEGGNSGVATNGVPYGLYANFVGKTASGSRVAWYMFNVGLNSLTANNRLTPAELAVVGDVVAALNASGGILCGIDQNPFTMQAYANSGINDRVAKKSRQFA